MAQIPIFKGLENIPTIYAPDPATPSSPIRENVNFDKHAAMMITIFGFSVTFAAMFAFIYWLDIFDSTGEAENQ